MHRILALCCCVASLAYGLVAGTAHVHEAADHHEEMRGLHLDHAHVHEAADAPAHHHGASPSDHHENRLDPGHVGHHEGDALYVTVAAQRSLDSGPRTPPVMVAVGATIEASEYVPVRRDEKSDRLRGPPETRPTPSRAPPA